MNFNPSTRSARIAVLAGAVALVLLGIAFAIRPQTASAPQQPAAAEQAPARTPHQLESGPSTQGDGNVYEYH